MSVETSEEIREQAAKLGYIAKQKGRIEMSAGSSVWHEYVSSGDPSRSEAPDRKKAAIKALDQAREQEVANADKVDQAVDMVLKARSRTAWQRPRYAHPTDTPSSDGEPTDRTVSRANFP